METEKFKLGDIFNGFIIPLILVFLIFVLTIYINPSGQYHMLGTGTGLISTLGVIFTQGFAQMIVLGIPLVLGLLWNKWAGGAAGFLMGSVYYVASAGLYNGYYATSSATYHNFYGDPSVLFWIVYGVFIGYSAGALSGGSSNFKRMLGAGLTASITTAFLQIYMNYNWSLNFAGGSASTMKYSPRMMAHGLWTTTSGAYTAGSVLYGFTLAFVPLIALGVIVPILAKVMGWYGIAPLKHQ